MALTIKNAGRPGLANILGRTGEGNAGEPLKGIHGLGTVRLALTLAGALMGANVEEAASAQKPKIGGAIPQKEIQKSGLRIPLSDASSLQKIREGLQLERHFLNLSPAVMRTAARDHRPDYKPSAPLTFTLPVLRKDEAFFNSLLELHTLAMQLQGELNRLELANHQETPRLPALEALLKDRSYTRLLPTDAPKDVLTLLAKVDAALQSEANYISVAVRARDVTGSSSLPDEPEPARRWSTVVGSPADVERLLGPAYRKLVDGPLPAHIVYSDPQVMQEADKGDQHTRARYGISHGGFAAFYRWPSDEIHIPAAPLIGFCSTGGHELGHSLKGAIHGGDLDDPVTYARDKALLLDKLIEEFDNLSHTQDAVLS